VNAQGAVCKGPCQSLTSKIEGGTVATLALINIVTTDCESLTDTIECAAGEFCAYTSRGFRAVYKDGAGTDEDGSYSEIGCATDITVVPCDFYDADYPMDFGHVEIQQSGCSILKDDEIPRAVLGLPEPTPEPEPEPETEEETVPAEPIKCSVCTDLVKVDAEGNEEAVAVEGAASCADASVVDCPADVTSCASIMLTYSDGGVNFRRTQKSCKEAALDCASLEAQLGEIDSTDCEVAETAVFVEPEVDGNETEEDKDEEYEVGNNVEEEAVKGTESSAITTTISTVFIAITLTLLW